MTTYGLQITVTDDPSKNVSEYGLTRSDLASNFTVPWWAVSAAATEDFVSLDVTIGLFRLHIWAEDEVPF